MRKKAASPSGIEITFAETPDGLVVDRILLHPASAKAEGDLRRFLERFRDPDLDLSNRAIRGEEYH